VAVNVLVVDDSAVMRAMIIRTIELAGLPVARVYEAADGAQGLAMLEEHQIDLGIVDINMPVMDGEEMIRRVRERQASAGVPLVVVSTEGSNTRIQRIEQQGVRFLHKPFTPEVLRNVVTGLLGEIT